MRLQGEIAIVTGAGRGIGKRKLHCGLCDGRCINRSCSAYIIRFRADRAAEIKRPEMPLPSPEI